MRYWLKLVNTVDRLEAIALDIEETMAGQKEQVISIKN